MEANPAEIPHQPLELAAFDRPVQAKDQARAIEDGIRGQLNQSHEPAMRKPREAIKSNGDDSPIFQVLAHNLGAKEYEQALRLAFSGHEAPEARVANIIPHLDPISHTPMCRLEIFVRISIHMRIRRKRDLVGCDPLTKEHASQCLAEEPLTLFRDGICSPPSPRFEALLVPWREPRPGRVRGEGGT